MSELREYDTHQVDIEAVLKSFNHGGVLVSLSGFKEDFFEVYKLDKYVDVDGVDALIVECKGHLKRDLKGYKTVMIRC